MGLIKNIFVSVILSFCFLSIPHVFAEDNFSVGFIQNPIWYSKDILVSGETVKIYTLIYNGSTEQLKGMVVFYNEKVVLGRREIIVPSKGVKDISIDWKLIAGTYKVRAVLENPVLVDLRGVEIKTVEITQETKESVVQVKEKELVQVQENIKDSGAQNISQQFTDLGNSLSTDIPQITQNTFLKINNFRAIKADFFENKKQKAQEEKNILSVKGDSVQSKAKSFIPDKPFAFIKYYVFTLLMYLFKIQIVFYVVLVLVLYFGLRFIYRKIKK